MVVLSTNIEREVKRSNGIRTSGSVLAHKSKVINDYNRVVGRS